ncbi:hypothetical protein C8N42_1011 [Celeribacter persicus]|uniref:Uncharacterized protein n=1 Tax=Celeribacter persicus TaxID=1651082 RepID=A0A2T5HVG1_9RHOB|nr:hypothetical protein C8N42_1011 [Celeribacter persicus]
MCLMSWGCVGFKMGKCLEKIISWSLIAVLTVQPAELLPVSWTPR